MIAPLVAVGCVPFCVRLLNVNEFGCKTVVWICGKTVEGGFKEFFFCPGPFFAPFPSRRFVCWDFFCKVESRMHSASVCVKERRLAVVIFPAWTFRFCKVLPASVFVGRVIFICANDAGPCSIHQVPIAVKLHNIPRVIGCFGAEMQCIPKPALCSIFCPTIGVNAGNTASSTQFLE